MDFVSRPALLPKRRNLALARQCFERLDRDDPADIEAADAAWPRWPSRKET